MAEHLLSKCKALSTNPNTAKIIIMIKGLGIVQWE
jgi:hypothetical protein